jgi:hypothetical protein
MTPETKKFLFTGGHAVLLVIVLPLLAALAAIGMSYLFGETG